MACSPVGCVTACVVYGRFDSRFDSNEKNDSQVPNSFRRNSNNERCQKLQLKKLWPTEHEPRALGRHRSQVHPGPPRPPPFRFTAEKNHMSLSEESPSLFTAMRLTASTPFHGTTRRMCSKQKLQLGPTGV